MRHEQGSIGAPIITATVLGVVAVLLGAFGIWAFMNYMDQKNNVDAKIVDAVAIAQTEQKADDEIVFAEREKSPVKKFTGPDDFGKVTFDYPKTWSVFIGEDNKAKYESYFHPNAVVAPARKVPYALRLTISGEQYETALKGYQAKVAAGDLKASPVTVNGQVGTRLDGEFSPTVKGAMVLLKIRDKTITIYTEAEDYLTDFDSTVIPSLTFNP